jgi:NADH-quinone oxidoreductase subunit M
LQLVPDVFEYHQELLRVSWLSRFEIYFALGLDSLSVLLIALTLFLGAICILVSWQEIKHNQGFYYFNLLASLSGIVGVFSATDLFLFFFFWEVMLLPMTALIAIWGHENRHYAAIKFFIFTQVSSLLMLASIIALAWYHQSLTGVLSFNYFELRSLVLPPSLAYWVMLGFFIAFAVKLPSFPVHTWLPDAHTQAPTAGSVLLAGVLLKTGAYGLIRFVIHLFPQASMEFAPVAATLGVISILYGAKMAFAQLDIKRLIAYSSISHMGFVMLALFTFSQLAYQGAVMTMIAHGLSSAALFAMAGMIYHRMHSRLFTDISGLWHTSPRLSGMLLVFVAAALGLPGLANFIGEFLSLTGSFERFPVLVIVAALGLIGSAIYAIVLFQQACHGEQPKPIQHTEQKLQVKQAAMTVVDLSAREWLITFVLAAALIYLGLNPYQLLTIVLGGGG